MFIIVSIRHDGGIYDYIQIHPHRITHDFHKAKRWHSYANANDYRFKMENSHEFEVIKLEQ